MAQKKKILKVTLKRSLIDEKPITKKTAWSLGLRKVGKVKKYEDSPSIRGMLRVVRHLVEVEEE